MSVSTTSNKMNILAISETSEKEEIGFLTNVEIEGYDLFHTASKYHKGVHQSMQIKILSL